MASQTDLIKIVIVGAIVLGILYYIMNWYGKANDRNTAAGQANPNTLFNPAYNPQLVTPPRSSYVPGAVGDFQFWLTQVTTDTSLRW